jgi:hypothetical protein
MNTAFLSHYTAGKNCRPCDWRRFLFGSCIHVPSFVKTRLVAQILRSAAEISTRFSMEALQLSYFAHFYLFILLVIPQ